LIYLISWAILFELALTLPLLALAFFWLAERRGTTKAYLILALLPTASFFLLLKFQQYLGNWPNTLLPEMLWLSLITFVFGLALAVRAYRNKLSWGMLLFAAIVSGVPFVLVVVMLYQMSQDEFLKHL
jgi:hypothetical protein